MQNNRIQQRTALIFAKRLMSALSPIADIGESDWHVRFVPNSDEAGYAAGRNLPVILTCRKDEVKKLHFDIRQYNCIDWETPDELARRLQVRIEAVIGDGPLKAK